LKIAVSEGEYKVLSAIAKLKGKVKEVELKTLSEMTGIPVSTLSSILALLSEKNLITLKERMKERIELSERGKKVLVEGLPEKKLIDLLKSKDKVDIYRIKETLGDESGIALGQAKRKDLIDIRKGKVWLKIDYDQALSKINGTIEALKMVNENLLPSKEVLKELKSRGFIRLIKTKHFYVVIPENIEEILNSIRVEISKLTHEILKSGEWRNISFRAYDVKSEPPKVLPARKHFLIEFIEMIRDIMKEMGFVEVEGPMIEVELFNFDALFQPQDHPAREIHDTLWIKEPSKADLSEYKDIVKRAKKVHERGWKYSWDPGRAAKIVLRSQTTAVSARTLLKSPKEPMRFFTIGKVFRADAVDASHLSDFHQLDGIEGWSEYTFRDLLGTLKEIAERLGLSIKFKPAYFPFTEPSVEGYVRLPNGKWLELFGAGLFRPEVLEILNVSYPVGAWGFGIERLAAAYYKINDIRVLYSKDYDFIRSFPIRF